MSLGSSCTLIRFPVKVLNHVVAACNSVKVIREAVTGLIVRCVIGAMLRLIHKCVSRW